MISTGHFLVAYIRISIVCVIKNCSSLSSEHEIVIRTQVTQHYTKLSFLLNPVVLIIIINKFCSLVSNTRCHEIGHRV